MDILDKICERTAARVAEREKELPLCEVKRVALARSGRGYPFERALKREGLSLICEVKKASPSKGVIDPVFDYLAIADDYESGGADCISCLTEPYWFLGSDEIFKEIRARVGLPMLRKDFTLGEYQVYESAALGADCVLIIMSALTEDRVKGLYEVADGLGMSALFECRSAAQIEAAQRLGARIIGVNNRNLRDFSVDTGKAGKLRSLVDRDRLFVSESGVSSLESLRAQALAGADACLVGEYFMRAADRSKLVSEAKRWLK